MWGGGRCAGGGDNRTKVLRQKQGESFHGPAEAGVAGAERQWGKGEEMGTER